MNTIYTNSRKEWRAWLSANFEKEKEVWFVFPMKAAGEEALPYNDAVEEALCFGWIDGVIKNIDPSGTAVYATKVPTFSTYWNFLFH